MDKRTSSGSAPLIQEQRDALRSLRDCGVIRARGIARYRYDALVTGGIATAEDGFGFSDYRLTPVIGRALAMDLRNVS